MAWTVAALLALAVVGLSVALGTRHGGALRMPAPFGAGPRLPGPAAGGFGAGGFRGNLATAGTVTSVGSGTFTVTDRSGQVVTVDEQPSTIYSSGGNSASSSAVVSGARVFVQGIRNGSTVTATRVVVLNGSGFGGGFG